MYALFKRTHNNLRIAKIRNLYGDHYEFKYASGGTYFIHEDDVIGTGKTVEEVKIKYMEYFV